MLPISYFFIGSQGLGRNNNDIMQGVYKALVVCASICCYLMFGGRCVDFSIAIGLAGLMNGSKYPRMSDLLDALRGDVTTSLGALINNEVESPDSKRLKKKDIIRRRRIRRAMRQFKE
ncbi:hypothetical protein OSTOST_23208, partial [Ostertagia ostertagi]